VDCAGQQVMHLVDAGYLLDPLYVVCCALVHLNLEGVGQQAGAALFSFQLVARPFLFLALGI